MRAGLNCRVTPPELRGVHRWQRRGREGRPRAGGKLPSPTAGGTPRASGGPPLAAARSRGPASRWRETPKSHGRVVPPELRGVHRWRRRWARGPASHWRNPKSHGRVVPPSFGGPPVSGGDVVGAGLDRGWWDPLHGRECPEEPPKYWGYALNSVGRPLQKPPTATARSKIENYQVPLESPEPDLRCMGARRFV